MSFLVIILLAGLLWIGYVENRIPKTGRAVSSRGSKITATITNSNKYADRAVTLRAEKDGRKFKVKMKPTEANLWIKGDSIDILLVENSKEYRILFNDYFRSNEQRIKEKALEKLKKTEAFPISARIIKCTKEDFELFGSSEFDSRRIFSFATYMRMIDICTVIAVLLGAAVLVWQRAASPKPLELLVAAVPVLLVVWSVYGAVTSCKRILKELKQTKE